MDNPLEFADTTRREVLRKAVFISPAILTLPVSPSFAKAGSNAAEQDDPNDGNSSGSSSGSSGDSQSPGRRRRRHHWWSLNW